LFAKVSPAPFGGLSGLQQPNNSNDLRKSTAVRKDSSDVIGGWPLFLNHEAIEILRLDFSFVCSDECRIAYGGVSKQRARWTRPPVIGSSSRNHHFPYRAATP
jgi:hypothetical protein